MIDHPIIGAWRLKSWRIETPDRAAHFPYGESPVGQLIYSADGRMLAAIAEARRADFANANPRKAKLQEKAEAFDSFFCYGGRFELDGEDVLHHVEIALNPAFVGSVQRRRMSLADQDLILSAEESSPQGTRCHSLHWIREARP